MPLLLHDLTVILLCVHQGRKAIWENTGIGSRGVWSSRDTSPSEHVVLTPGKQVGENLIMRDSNTFWDESGEASCPGFSAPLRHLPSKASRLRHHQATTKVTTANSPTLSEELYWFCSNLKYAIGSLWDLPLASVLLAHFTIRLRTCNRKDPNAPAAHRSRHLSENNRKSLFILTSSNTAIFAVRLACKRLMSSWLLSILHDLDWPSAWQGKSHASELWETRTQTFPCMFWENRRKFSSAHSEDSFIFELVIRWNPVIQQQALTAKGLFLPPQRHRAKQCYFGSRAMQQPRLDTSCLAGFHHPSRCLRLTRAIIGPWLPKSK